MSQTNKGGVPKLKIVNKTPGKISVGANTQVYLDGQLMPTVHFIKLEFHAKKATKCLIEMFIDPEIEIDSDIRLASKVAFGNLTRGTFKSKI